LSDETKSDDNLLRFLYNVVSTRAFPSHQDGDVTIVPVADYFNHGFPDNVVLYYNDNGDCEVYCTEDVPPGRTLTLSYGTPMDPSRLLATYGFLTDDQPATYCKILFTNPSDRLIEVGYDPERMVFYRNGEVAREVWDVLLFSWLERTPGMADAKTAFYQAHVSGDDPTKYELHERYQHETCTALLKHVDTVLTDVEQLTKMMKQFQNNDRHPRLPLLLRHHAMVIGTFRNVKDRLEAMMYG
jgi:hypothetical protein